MTWQDDAVCAQTDPEVFFGDTHEGKKNRKAKAICARCMVQLECLLDSLGESGKLFGVRAGYTNRQRMTMRETIQANRRTA